MLAVVLLTTAAHRQLPSGIRAQQGDAWVPQPQFAKALSLGFDALLGDYYWVQAVLLAGESANPQAESTQLGRLIDVVTTLDPWVDHPYRFAAVWLTETLDDVRHGNDLLRRSFAYHRDDWRNRFYLGFNLFYYLEDNAAAADELHQASLLPGAPTYLPRLVARLRSESAGLAAAGLFLEELVRSTEDEDARAEYQAALDEVQIEWRARQLDDARERYRKLHGRDIASVEELVSGEGAVLASLPDPEPSSLPASLRRGSRWLLDEETGEIVSSYYGRRYELYIDDHGRRPKARVEARTDQARLDASAGARAKQGGNEADGS